MGIQEKLASLYGNTQKPKQSSSRDWIPQRLSDDPFRQLKKTLPLSTELSHTRAEEILNSQTFHTEAINLIREQARISIIELSGAEKIDDRMGHFDSSLEKVIKDLTDEYGDLLIEAMLEMADERELTGHDGYIDKKSLKKKLKEIKKRHKSQ